MVILFLSIKKVGGEWYAFLKEVVDQRNTIGLSGSWTLG
jgi:hypothetical protein